VRNEKEIEKRGVSEVASIMKTKRNKRYGKERKGKERKGKGKKRKRRGRKGKEMKGKEKSLLFLLKASLLTFSKIL